MRFRKAATRIRTLFLARIGGPGDFMSKPCIPLHQVQPGAVITPRLTLTNARIRNWKFASECSDVGDGLTAGNARLEVIEVAAPSLNSTRWLKVAVVGMSPAPVLKLNAEEYANLFLAV
jgi:hypothetical protein